MNLIRDPRPSLADGAAPRTDDVLWQHGAFCGLALPSRATKDVWQREIGATTVRLEPAEGMQGPSGRFLRLALMQICDAAYRTRSPVVDLGESPAAWAARLGLELDAAAHRDLAAQMNRLLTGRTTISVSGPELSMLDARGRRRQDETGWQPSVRLNSRFLASLLGAATPLDRGVVLHLWTTPEALDAYAWIAQGLHAREEPAFAEKWADIQQRFGRGAQAAAAFRAGFEELLRAVTQADPSLETTVTEAGVSVRKTTEAPIHPGAAEAADPDEPVLVMTEAPTAEVPVAPAIESSVAPEAARPERTETPEPPIAPRPPSVRTDVALSDPPPARPATPVLQDQVSLPHHLTGLPVVIWLRRGHGDENIVIGATPGARFEADRLTVLALEPMLLQVSGGLQQRDFEQVSAWVMANRDLIDDFWEGGITTHEDLRGRVQSLRGSAWR